MKRKGITEGSKWAEKKLMAIIGGIDNVPKKDGDVWKNYGSFLAKLEIKATNSEEVDSREKLVLNQVRPYKGHTVIAYVGNLKGFTKEWVVYPNRYQLEYGSSHTGQHTRDGLVCVNMVCSPADEEKFGCDSHELDDAIIKAHHVSSTADCDFARNHVANRLFQASIENPTLHELLIEGRKTNVAA